MPAFPSGSYFKKISYKITSIMKDSLLWFDTYSCSLTSTSAPNSHPSSSAAVTGRHGDARLISCFFPLQVILTSPTLTLRPGFRPLSHRFVLWSARQAGVNKSNIKASIRRLWTFQHSNDNLILYRIQLLIKNKRGQSGNSLVLW